MPEHGGRGRYPNSFRRNNYHNYNNYNKNYNNNNKRKSYNARIGGVTSNDFDNFGRKRGRGSKKTISYINNNPNYQSRGGQNNNSNYQNNNNNRDMSTVVCHNCGKTGHYAKTCYSKRKAPIMGGINADYSTSALTISSNNNDNKSNNNNKNTSINSTPPSSNNNNNNNYRGNSNNYRSRGNGKYGRVRMATACMINGDHEPKLIFIKLSNDHTLYEAYPDTGADFEIISKELAEKLNLEIIPPLSSELQFIKLADKSYIKRLGYVIITGELILPESDINQGRPIKFTKKFEVMECEHSFLLGTGFLPVIFQSDEILKYLTPHSSITSPPHIYSLAADPTNDNNNNNNMNISPSPILPIRQYNDNLSITIYNHDHIITPTISLISSSDNQSDE